MGGLSMEVSIAFSAYILLAFWLYRKEKRFWKKVIRYIKERAAIPDSLTALVVLIAMLFFPLTLLQGTLRGLFAKLGGKKQQEEPEEEDVKDFLHHYYPEVEDRLEAITIVLEPQEAGPFLSSITRLFDSGFGLGECGRVEKALAGMAEMEEEEEKLTFSVEYNGVRNRLVLEILRENEEELELTFYGKKELTEALDKAMEGFLAQKKE